MKTRSDALQGVLIGTAIGDALGLHREGLTAKRAQLLYGGAPLSYRLIFNYGMVSDDTEHTCMVAQSILSSPEDPERFARAFGWRLRWWLAALPAGLGLGTLRAVLRLWVGFSPKTSGVFTAGNAPAMRSAIIGACYSDIEELKSFVRASTQITHADPKAFEGALCIALAVREAVHQKMTDPETLLASLEQHITGEELRASLGAVRGHLERGSAVEDLTRELKIEGFVSGYINHTVPVALFCWLRYLGDFRRSIEAGILAGGDSDTVGAIVGALAGGQLGASQIPKELREGLIEWPRSKRWMEELARRLALQFSQESEAVNSAKPQRAPLVLWPLVLVRNLFFFLWVFRYGVRRFFPPY